MTLTAGLDIARSSLSTTATQTAVVSRNIAAAGDPLAARKAANAVTTWGGGTRIASITRASDSALLQHLFAAASASTRSKTIVEALDRLNATVGDPELDASPAALLGKLQEALQLYAAGPHDSVRARSAVAAAADLVEMLHDATRTVQGLREQADAEIASSVGRLNGLLGEFELVNGEIVKGTRAGVDVTDQLDARDRLLRAMSEEIGIRTITRADNDMIVLTDGGVTLFETRPRSVSFEPTLVFSPTTTGHPVVIDGVQVTGATGAMASRTGRLSGLTAVRDEIAATYQGQLDEIARGLIEAFSERDQGVPPAQPDAPGLFTWPGAPALPPSGSLVPGLAGRIVINASVDPIQGGDPSRLRDGGMNGLGYIYNPSGAEGFSARLQELIEQMSLRRNFDPAVGLAPSANLADLSASSTGWLQEARRSASAEAEYKTTLLERSSEALSRATGVNLDEEMMVLLELERSYQATSRLISTIDGMFRALLSTAG